MGGAGWGDLEREGLKLHFPSIKSHKIEKASSVHRKQRKEERPKEFDQK